MDDCASIDPLLDAAQAEKRRCAALRRRATEHGERALRELEKELAPIERRLEEVERELNEVSAHRELARRLSERLDSVVSGLTRSIDDVWTRHSKSA